MTLLAHTKQTINTHVVLGGVRRLFKFNQCLTMVYRASRLGGRTGVFGDGRAVG